MKPRDYQDYAVNSVINYFAQGKKGNPVIAMPTGTGKSIVIAEFVRRVCTQWPGQRIIMLTHVKELITQNFDKLTQIWPTAPAGIYSAGVGKREAHFPVTFAGIQSVHSKGHLFGHVDLLLVDECHLIPAKSTTMYRKFINFLTKVNPNLKVIGLTATAYRVGMGCITDEDGIFTDICCDMTELEVFNWFFDQGYLATLVPKKTQTEIDLSNVGTERGDYKQSDLQNATDKERITYECVCEMVAIAELENRNHWLIFGTGVDHVNHIVTELINQNVTAVAVHSKMTDVERDTNIELFKKGKVTALVNMGVLTTGFDCPFVDLIGMIRATKSPGLWIQMLGRGTRPYYLPDCDLSTREGRLYAIAMSEKPNCLVMDFAANTSRLGPINDPVLPKKKGKGGGDAPVRLCEGIKADGTVCDTYIHASLQVCPYCGKEYPPETKFHSGAGTNELIAKEPKKDPEPEVDIFKVDLVTYRLKSGRIGNPNYIEVSYQCGLRRFQQPLCLEHDGFAKHKSRDWWCKATGNSDREQVPETLEQAIARWPETQTPKFIRVWVNKKPYPQIMFVDYEGELSEQ